MTQIKQSVLVLCAFIGLLLSTSLLADEKDKFSPLNANKTLHQLTLSLSIKDVDADNLEKAAGLLLVLKKKAQSCIALGEDELKETDALLKGVDIKKIDFSKLSKDQQYLVKKRQSISNKVASCRLFEIRANEAIDTFSEKAAELASRALFKAEPGYWSHLKESHTLPSAFIKNYNLSKMKKVSGLKLFFDHKFAFFIILFLGIFFGIKFRKIIARQITHELSDKFPTVLQQALLCVLKRYEIPLLSYTLLAIYMYFLTKTTGTLTILALLSYGFLGFILFLVLITFFFRPPPPAEALIKLPDNIAKPMVFRLEVIGAVCLFAFVIYAFMLGQSLPPVVVQLPVTLFESFVIIGLISIVWLLKRAKGILGRHEKISFLIRGVLLTGLLLMLLFDWVGYHYLITYILIGIATTLLTFMFAIFIQKLLISGITSLSNNELPWQHKFRAILGIEPSSNLFELYWLKIGIYLMVWTGFFLAALKVWGLSETDYRIVVRSMTAGFEFANIQIVPSRLISAIFFFVVFVLLTRLIKQNLLKRKKAATSSRGARQALSVIAGYIGFSFAVIFALLIAGVNFAGLALVAGALSVGIGFGLQSVVNNFVSGLILLIERPVKIGDRIIVGGVEGHVKSVSIRSTIIRTLDRADIIVPNAELIATQVKNMMFQDQQGRISNFVGVAYGSNVEKVAELLMKVSKDHPDVIEDSPEVLLKSFSDNAIDFELRSILRDIDRKISAHSELNFAIDKIFRENGIVIPFPQRDVHVVSDSLLGESS